jgi:hypothetical protein
MPCPFLKKATGPRCGAVAGNSGAPPRLVIATLCRAGYQACPAFRFTRSSGKLLHPADFVAWVVRGIPAGCEDPIPQPG